MGPTQRENQPVTDEHPDPDVRSSIPVTLLDCTLRDGGYYNDWDYSPTLIGRYLATMSAARIPVVELGFRTTESGRYMGPTAYTTDRYLESLDLPDNVAYGVMVNAKELVAGSDSSAMVARLFRERADSKLELVRIAANFSELALLEAGVDRLHQFGYRVGVNLMQIANRTTAEIEEFGRMAASWDVAMAYFADSFGGMRPDEITSVVHVLKAAFGGPVGCHAHDNMSLAFANSIAAVDAGATFVDSTVLGMGRGPGNARTEYVAFELARRGVADIDAIQLLPLVSNEFTKMQRKFGWGSNIYYFLSAANGVHPTYIQELTKDGRYTVDDIVPALQRLGQGEGSTYSRERLDAATQTAVPTGGSVGSDTAAGTDDPAGTDDVSGWCAGRDVLIVGPGPAGSERRSDIEHYIRSTRPVVMALNAVPAVDPALVDAYAICDPVRALIDMAEIADLDRPLFMPASVQARLEIPPPSDFVRDYGLSVEPHTLRIGAMSCTVPRGASFPYALALAAIGGAREIFLTGFDGFEPADPRQAEMDQIFTLFRGEASTPTITSLTATTHSVLRSSIYAR